MRDVNSLTTLHNANLVSIALEKVFMGIHGHSVHQKQIIGVKNQVIKYTFGKT